MKAMTTIPLQFKEQCSAKGNTVTTIVDENNDPWFVAKDVCAVLGFDRPDNALRTLDFEEKRVIALNPHNMRGQGGARHMSIINESGLYCLILRSRKPQAKTGAGTATVCKELAVALNEGAAEQDRVTATALRDRVKRMDGSKEADRLNNSTEDPPLTAAENARLAELEGDISVALKERVRQMTGLKDRIDHIKPEDPPTDDIQQTWTCTECGGTFPLGQEKCNCPGQQEEPEDREEQTGTETPQIEGPPSLSNYCRTLTATYNKDPSPISLLPMLLFRLQWMSFTEPFNQCLPASFQAPTRHVSEMTEAHISDSPFSWNFC